MKQCKTFSLIYTEEAISYLRTLNPEMTRGLGYVDTRPYIRISLGTRINYGGNKTILKCSASTKQQGPLLDLDHVKALTLLPPEAWHEYLKHLKKEYYDGNKGKKDRPSS